VWLTEVELDSRELVVVGILKEHHLNPWVLVLKRRQLLGDELSETKHMKYHVLAVQTSVGSVD